MPAKYFSIPIVAILTSFFYFPFYFTFFPVANTKMILAACGLVMLFFNLSKTGKGMISRDFFMLSLLALGVSFASFIAMALNNTPDSAYLSYIVSMWVWVGAAYCVVNVIKAVHGKVTVELVCFYMIAVGVCQCLIAVTIDLVPPVKAFVNSFLAGEGFMGKFEGRLYGIGCALDVAGGRMAVLLVMIAFLLPRMLEKPRPVPYLVLLLGAFCIIAVIGNMIGRTATVGMVLAMMYMAYTVFTDRVIKDREKKTVLTNLLVVFVVCAAVSFTVLYNVSGAWHKYLRFGFEGFFSLVEKGRWEVTSNEMLKEGLVFPDNLKTWIIGDGYMGAMEDDPYYQGELWYGYYQGTDSGYSRFLFYFGITGLGIFMLFMARVCGVCMKRFVPYRYMFLVMLLLCYIIWIKVSTDIFLAFAMFLCFGNEDSEEEDGRGSIPEKTGEI